MTGLAGIFDSKVEANQAVVELLEMGFKRENISLIASENTYNSIFTSPTDDVNARSAKGSFTGALLGGALGAIVSSLTEISISIPGIGHIEGHGITMLVGACVGIAAGGLSGALVGAGFAEDTAEKYKHAIRQGKAVVIIHAVNDKVVKARVALRNSGAIIKAA